MNPEIFTKEQYLNYFTAASQAIKSYDYATAFTQAELALRILNNLSPDNVDSETETTKGHCLATLGIANYGLEGQKGLSKTLHYLAEARTHFNSPESLATIDGMRMIYTARLAITKGNTGKALNSFNASLSYFEDAKNQEALLNTAKGKAQFCEKAALYYHAVHAYDVLLSHHKKAEELPFEEIAELLLKKGTCLLKAEQYTKAKESFAQAYKSASSAIVIAAEEMLGGLAHSSISSAPCDTYTRMQDVQRYAQERSDICTRQSKASQAISGFYTAREAANQRSSVERM